MIELQNINKTYYSSGQSVHALRDINLNIQAGEIYGILGKSGAGKSTLLRCVNLLEKPTSGKVIVNSIDLTVLSATQLKQQRQKISMIFQHFNLLESRTAYENISLPLELIGINKKETRERVDALLELVQLTDRKNHYPSQLSGGQKQRVAIARALTTKPHLLLCDEATSALDPESTRSILNLLKSINKELNLTILLITHELDVIKRLCDRAGVLDDGYLIEEGTVIDIFAEPKTPITKRLTQQAMHLELPNIIAEKLRPDFQEGLATLVRLTFIGHSSDTPLITTLAKQFAIDVNILQANIELVQDTTIGFTVCQFTGNQTAIKKALDFVHSLSIKTEVLGYV